MWDDKGSYYKQIIAPCPTKYKNKLVRKLLPSSQLCPSGHTLCLKMSQIFYFYSLMDLFNLGCKNLSLLFVNL